MGLHDRLKTSNGSSSATAELLTGGRAIMKRRPRLPRRTRTPS